jgi:hypothetical protein
VAARREAIEQGGTQLAFVHTGREADAAAAFARYGLGDVPRFSDPEGGLYRAFGLGRSGLRTMFAPRVWLRGVQAAFLKGYGVGGLQGDGLRLPGVFLVHRGQIVRAFRHATPADRPDYESLACPPG